MIYELVKKWSYACNPKNVSYSSLRVEKDAIVKQLNETDFYVSSAEGVGAFGYWKISFGHSNWNEY